MNKFKMSKRSYMNIHKAIQFHEDTRGSFYWHSQGSASGRKYKEKKMNEEAVNGTFIVYEILKTKEKKHEIKIKQNYSESARNVYVTSEFYFDGKKSTITKLNNIILNGSYPHK